MNYRLDKTSKDRIEATKDLSDHVSAIHAEVHTGIDGQEELQILINLSPSIATNVPSTETGQILNTIASTVRERAADIPLSAVGTFSKENEA